MTTYTVYTYGGGDALYEVFNAVASLMGGGDYLTLIRMFGVLSLFWVVIKMGVLQRTINWHWFIMFMLMFNIFFVPKGNVVIVDRLNPAATRVVANVPFGLAAPAWLFSLIGDGLTTLAEAVFTPPGDMQYHNTGMVFGSRLMLAINNARFDDPLLNKNLTVYAKQCIYYNIAYGFYSVRDVYQSQDLKSLLLSPANNSSIRGMFYDNGGGTTLFLTCRQAASQLVTDITPVVDGMIGRFADALFAGSGQTQAQNRGRLLAALPATYGYLANISTTASQMVTQSALSNFFQNSYGQVASMAGATAAATAWTVAVAERQQRSAYRTMGEIAARALPLMQTVFQVMIYAAFFIVFLTLLLPVTVSGKALSTYLKMLIWIQLWPVLYAILNMVVSLYDKSATRGVVDGSLGITSMAGLQGMIEVNSDIAIIAGYLALSIPLMAWGFVTAGGFAFSQLAQHLFMPGTQAATQAGAEIARGNISSGNLQAGNQSMMQQQTAPNMNLGSQFSDGAFAQHFSPGGRVASQLMNSDLGVGASNRESLMHNVSTARGHAEAVEQQHAQSVSQAQSAQSTAADQLVETARRSEGSGLRNEVSNVVGDVQSFQSSREVAHNFAREHNLTDTQATQVLANTSAAASGGFELFGTGGKVSAQARVQGASESSLQDAYKDATSGKAAEAWSHAQQVENRLANTASRESSAMHSTDAGRSLVDAHTRLSQEQDQYSAAHRKTEDMRSAEAFASSHSRDVQATANDYLEEFAVSRGIDVHDTASRGEIEKLARSEAFSEFVLHKSGMDVDINGDGRVEGWKSDMASRSEHLEGNLPPVSDPTGAATANQKAADIDPSQRPDMPEANQKLAAGRDRATADAANVESGKTHVADNLGKIESNVDSQSTHIAARAFEHTAQNIKDQLPEAAGGFINGVTDGEGATLKDHSVPGTPLFETPDKTRDTGKLKGTPGTLGGEKPGVRIEPPEKKDGKG